ncbi:MAG: DUF2007 domain-containing protein [Planctomycetota bacterium]
MIATPACVRRATTMEEAEIVAAWLQAKGVKATIVDRENPGVRAFGVTDIEGVGVYVLDAESVEEAKRLLEEHDREKESTARARNVPVQPRVIPCMECGQGNTFSQEFAGTVQQCSKCGAYLDLP